MLLTWLDVVSDNAHVFISVWPCMFVPEANHVAQFMHDYPKLVTVLAYGNSLWTPAPSPHIGATPGGTQEAEGHRKQRDTRSKETQEAERHRKQQRDTGSR